MILSLSASSSANDQSRTTIPSPRSGVRFLDRIEGLFVEVLLLASGSRRRC